MRIRSVNVIHQVLEGCLTGGVGNNTMVETSAHTGIAGLGNRVVVAIKQSIGGTPGFSLIIFVRTAEGQFHVVAFAHDEVKLQLTEIIPIAGIFSDAFFVERLAGKISGLLIIDTVFRCAVTKRFGDDGLQRFIVGHPCASAGGGSVMGVGNLTAEQETDTGRIVFGLALQQGTGDCRSNQEVVVTVNGSTQFQGTVEVLGGLFGGDHREGGTVTVFCRHTALDQLDLLDRGHGDTATTADAHTIDDGLLTIGTVTTDTGHGTIHRGDALEVCQCAGHGTTRRRTDVVTGHTAGGCRVILGEHRGLPRDHNLIHVRGKVDHKVFEHDLIGRHRDVGFGHRFVDHHCVGHQVIRSGLNVEHCIITLVIGGCHVHDTVTDLQKHPGISQWRIRLVCHFTFDLAL